MEEFICRNCGKKNLQNLVMNRVPKTFCDRKCFEEYQKKRKEASEKKKLRGASMSPTKTPPEQCRKCQYGLDIGGLCGCGYIFMKGHSRHSLHPGGLPDKCQEFERRKRGRPRKI